VQQQGQHGPLPLLHSITENITEHHNVSKRRVVRSSAPFFPGDSPATPVGKKSTGGGGETAVDAAEASASNDCASEAAGEVSSSTAVSIDADIMSCVQGRSDRSREQGRRRGRVILRGIDFSKLIVMRLAPSNIVQALINQKFHWVLLFILKDHLN
jgi:hypothetical protein